MQGVIMGSVLELMFIGSFPIGAAVSPDYTSAGAICTAFAILTGGGPSRIVLELAGYKNIRSKSLGSNNKQNVVLATIEGLKNLKTPEQVAKLRGKSVEELLG